MQKKKRNLYHRLSTQKKNSIDNISTKGYLQKTSSKKYLKINT